MRHEDSRPWAATTTGRDAGATARWGAAAASTPVASGCGPVAGRATLWRALLWLLVVPFAAMGADEVVIQRDRYVLAGLPGGVVELRAPNGRTLVALQGYRFEWAPARTDGGECTPADLPDGREGIRVAYRVVDAPAGDVRIEGLFEALPRYVHATFTIEAPDDTNLAGAMILRTLGQGGWPEQTLKMGRWVRHEHGGVPYEAPDGLLFRSAWPEVALFSAVPGNAEWGSDWARHCPPKRLEPGRFEARFDLVPAVPDARGTEAAALLGSRPVAIDAWSDQPFHLWDSAAQPLPLTVETANVTEAPLEVKRSWWARDLDGAVLATGDEARQLAGEERWRETLSVPAPERGIVFVEVRAEANGQEAFTRTTLAVLPPHEFGSGAESIFGLAATFPVPSQADVDRLMQRMGVRSLRGGDPRRTMPLGIAANWHGGLAPDAMKDKPAEREEYLRQLIRECDERGNPYLEFGNEWNMTGGIGKAALAETYVRDWLLPLDRIRREAGSQVKLLSLGLSGPDPAFLARVKELGGWDALDGLAVHPGRGNYTADCTDREAPGEYWTFLGAVQQAKAAVAQLGDKPIWVTEAYACTYANSYWHDSLRHAAENVVLTYALAMEEGLRCLHWYQLLDATWYDIGGVNDKDSEYSYGLLYRDGSIKPSLLAYCTIAEALDQAQFVGRMAFDTETAHGLLFRRLDGPVAILWDRSDGYVLSKKSEDYASPEPWVDPWPTKVTVALPAAGESVRVLDCIGRETVVPAQDGRVTLTLDGAPRIVYGLAEE